jgi:hypothetical protein
MWPFSAIRHAWHRQQVAPPSDRPEKYLFIICMNNSGSTLLERVLRDCGNAIAFPAAPDAQTNGQQFVRDFMPIPGRIDKKNRRIWTEHADMLEDESLYNWPIIKQRWRWKWSTNPKFQTAGTRVFLEKSPPNVLRASMLQKHFDNSFFILMQRNPYAVSEGIRRRTKLPLNRCIRHWIRCAFKQMRNEEQLERAIRLNYEDLSERAEFCRDQILNLIPELDDLDMHKDVAVQGVEGKIRQPIVNYNAKQIALLGHEDISTINTELDKVPEVMSHFGYEYIRV